MGRYVVYRENEKAFPSWKMKRETININTQTMATCVSLR